MSDRRAGLGRLRLLDGCCGGGGAGVGYARAGFDVLGVDIAEQPDYPLPFARADVLTVDVAGFDVVHVSPPCQRFSTVTPARVRDCWPDLVTPLRERLRAAVRDGLIGAYVIENVPGAPLRLPAMVCGSAFGLGVRRHRLFESSVPLAGTGCAHGGPVVQVYGGQPPEGVSAARAAMGIDWLPWDRLTEAIPPAYTHYLGAQLRRHLDQVGTVTRPAVLTSPPGAGHLSPGAGAFRHATRGRSVSLVEAETSRGCCHCGESLTVPTRPLAPLLLACLPASRLPPPTPTRGRLMTHAQPAVGRGSVGFAGVTLRLVPSGSGAM